MSVLLSRPLGGLNTNEVLNMSEPKVFLWAHPRTASTAFLRSMMTVDGGKVIREPHSDAYHFGSERVCKRYPDLPIVENATFQDATDMLEKAALNEQGAPIVFAKGLAYYLSGKLDTAEFIPKGYTHCFLIRNPSDAIMAYYDGSLKNYTGEDAYFDEAEIGLKEVWQVYQLVKDMVGESNILVMDSDDLTRNPELVLKELCRRTGIPFSKQMVEWGEAVPDSVRARFTGDFFESWVSPILKTTGFHTSFRKVRNLKDYPEFVKELIEENQPYYDELYAHRFILQ